MRCRAMLKAALFSSLLFIPALFVFASDSADPLVFTASGDFAANANTDASLRSIRMAGGRFHLALGDLSYNKIVPESAWCAYVKKRVGADFPFMLIAGNH